MKLGNIRKAFGYIFGFFQDSAHTGLRPTFAMHHVYNAIREADYSHEQNGEIILPDIVCQYIEPTQSTHILSCILQYFNIH